VFIGISSREKNIGAHFTSVERNWGLDLFSDAKLRATARLARRLKSSVSSSRFPQKN